MVADDEPGGAGEAFVDDFGDDGGVCVGVGGSDERGGDVCDPELGESGVQSGKDERGEIEKQSTGVAGD